MKTPKNLIRVSAGGQLPGLQVIGYHGQLDDEQTPARCGAVLAVDEKGRGKQIVSLGEIRPARGGKRLVDGYEVGFEVIGQTGLDGELPGIGTLIGPWPARLNHYVVVLGQRECRVADRFEQQESRPDEPERVHEFLRWLKGQEPRSERLTAERSHGLIAWYCSEEEAYALWTRMQPVVRAALFHDVRRGRQREICDTAFWLSRAGLGDADMYLAAAAMRRVDYPHWGEFIDAFVKQVTDEQRRRGLQDAEDLLERPPLAYTTGLGPHRRKRQQHQAIKQAFAGLKVA